MNHSRALNKVVDEFNRNRILLESDSHFPNVVTLVIGEPIKGSWWGHSKGREIWYVLNEFMERKDVLATRLVSGKVTFLHRSLWQDFLTIATSKEKWQTGNLSEDAKRLLRILEKKGSFRTDAFSFRTPLRGAIGDATRELEKSLLIYSEEVHTEKGSHAKRFYTWSRWAAKLKLKPKQISPTASKEKFETIVNELNWKHRSNGTLPWVITHALSRIP
jgi:hypothetical protein